MQFVPNPIKNKLKPFRNDLYRFVFGADAEVTGDADTANDGDVETVPDAGLVSQEGLDDFAIDNIDISQFAEKEQQSRSARTVPGSYSRILFYIDNKRDRSHFKFC